MLKTRSIFAPVGCRKLQWHGPKKRRLDGSRMTSHNHVDESSSHQHPHEHRVCNERYQGILSIRDSSDNKGMGLFASKDFAAGDLVMSSRSLAETKTSGSHTVQIDWETHILMDLPAILINHSCDANIGIRNNTNGVVRFFDGKTSSSGAYDFFAIRSIQKGEELTWDYEASEWELCTPFQCGCGSPKCRGKLSGFKHNADVIRNRYGEYYADYLKHNKE